MGAAGGWWLATAGCAGDADAVGGRSLRISNCGATGRIDRCGGVLAFISGGAWFEGVGAAPSFFGSASSASGLFESRGGFFWKIREKTLIYFPPGRDESRW